MRIALIRKIRQGGFTRPACLLLAFLLLVLLTGAGAAEGAPEMLNASGNRNLPLSVDPSRKSEGFSAVLYDLRNDLPTSEANAIAQTDEGFIWVGSDAGLFRYDGNQFELIDSVQGLANVRCLYVDSRNRLWIGTNDSGLFCLEKGEFRKWDRTTGFPSGAVRVITGEGKGALCIAGAFGIAMMDGEDHLSFVEDDRIAGATIREARTGVDGLVYCLTQNGDLFTLKEGKVAFFLSCEDCRIEGVSALFPDPLRPGEVYVGTGESRIYYGNLEKNFSSMGMKEIKPLSSVNRFEYIDGKLWICAENGVGNVDAEGFSSLKNLPMNRAVDHVMTDGDGNLWFTSSRQGVMKIVPNQFTSLFERYGLPETGVNATALLEGNLFVGTDEGLIVIGKDGKRLSGLPLAGAATASGMALEAEDLIAWLNGVRVCSIIRDSRDRLWISTWRSRGLLRYDQGKLTAFTSADGLLSDQMRTVYECEDGSILVATSDGVNVIREDRVSASYGVEEGIPIANSGILCVTEGFEHELVLGSDGNGILVITSDGVRRIGLEEGLNSETILRIKRGRTRENYWIVTGNSMAIMTPDFQVTTVKEFPHANNFDVYENSRGDLWMLSTNGIRVILVEEQQKGETANPVFYGLYSGLPGTLQSESFSTLTENGDLYLCGAEGVYRVNIENQKDYISDLKLAVPYLEADGERIDPDEAGVFHVSRYARKLTIFPYVFNYTMIDPRVSYKLEGLDLDETTVNRRELEPVYYTNLLNGSYHFNMRVKDPVGRTEKSSSFEIVKGGDEPPGLVTTVILDLASLFFLIGIMISTALYRRRGLLQDKIFFVMLLINMAVCVGDCLAYLVEGTNYSFARAVMTAGNMICFGGVNTISFLYLIFVEYRRGKSGRHLFAVALAAAIPLLLVFALLGANLSTGWVFSFDVGNLYCSGPYSILVCLPVALYFLLAMIRGYKDGVRMVILAAVLILTRVLWDVWKDVVSSTAFIFTLFLMCLHVHTTNRSLYEVKND